MTARPLLICVMGIDGSGKSTAVTRVVESLAQDGHDIGYLWNRWEPELLAPLLRTRALGKSVAGDSEKPHEPGEVASPVDEVPVDSLSSEYGSKRRLLANPLVASAWLAVASFDYARTGVPRVQAALAAHETTLCDRYTADFVVDQAMNLGGGATALDRAARAPWLGSFSVPDLHVLFDIPAAVAHARKPDVPSLAVLEAKRELYRDLGRRLDAVVVDAAGTAPQAASALLDAVERAISGRRA